MPFRDKSRTLSYASEPERVQFARRESDSALRFNSRGAIPSSFATTRLASLIIDDTLGGIFDDGVFRVCERNVTPLNTHGRAVSPIARDTRCT